MADHLSKMVPCSARLRFVAALHYRFLNGDAPPLGLSPLGCHPVTFPRSSPPRVPVLTAALAAVPVSTLLERFIDIDYHLWVEMHGDYAIALGDGRGRVAVEELLALIDEMNAIAPLLPLPSAAQARVLMLVSRVLIALRADLPDAVEPDEARRVISSIRTASSLTSFDIAFMSARVVLAVRDAEAKASAAVEAAAAAGVPPPPLPTVHTSLIRYIAGNSADFLVRAARGGVPPLPAELQGTSGPMMRGESGVGGVENASVNEGLPPVLLTEGATLPSGRVSTSTSLSSSGGYALPEDASVDNTAMSGAEKGHAPSYDARRYFASMLATVLHAVDILNREESGGASMKSSAIALRRRGDARSYAMAENSAPISIRGTTQEVSMARPVAKAVVSGVQECPTVVEHANTTGSSSLKGIASVSAAKLGDLHAMTMDSGAFSAGATRAAAEGVFTIGDSPVHSAALHVQGGSEKVLLSANVLTLPSMLSEGAQRQWGSMANLAMAAEVASAAASTASRPQPEA